MLQYKTFLSDTLWKVILYDLLKCQHDFCLVWLNAKKFAIMCNVPIPFSVVAQ